MTSPEMTVETAIATARQYAEEKEIDLSNKFIIRAQYERDMRNQFKHPYWSVQWSVKTISKGGDVEIRIYNDGSKEEFYYK